MSPARRYSRLAFAAYIVVTLILGGIVGYDSASDGQFIGRYRIGVQALTGLVIVMGIAVSVFWWRGIDEAQREAHKWAWYWGGSIGLLVLMPILVLSRTGDVAIMSIADAIGFEGHLFEMGLITAFIPTITGYGIAWLIWWWRHR